LGFIILYFFNKTHFTPPLKSSLYLYISISYIVFYLELSINLLGTKWCCHSRHYFWGNWRPPYWLGSRGD